MVLRSTSSYLFLLVSTLWLLLAPLPALCLELEGSNHDIKTDEEISAFMDYQLAKHNHHHNNNHQLRHHHHRGLQQPLPSPFVRDFGSRCGANSNTNQCATGMDCTPVNFGNRCLPNNDCLEQSFAKRSFDVDRFTEKLYSDAGYSKDQVLAVLDTSKNQRAFLKTDEWKALTQSFHKNMAPLNQFIQQSNECINPNQDNSTRQDSTVSYIGLHVEGGALIDFSISYVVATNGDDQRTMLRMCPGLELGVSAEISYLIGFTNTAETINMVCAAVFADVDIVLLVAGGVAIGCGFNGVFFYEFTVGGGLGLGIGAGFCASFEQASTLDTNVTLPPSRRLSG